MKHRTVATLVTLALVATSAAAVAGIERAGTTVANFLSVGSGAGILGMGGATLGWGADLNAAGWNAAAVGWVDETQVVLSHAGVADQATQEWAAVGGRLMRTRTHWALTGLYRGNGTIDGRDAAGIPTGSFGASSMAIGATVARGFAGIVTFGLGAKFVTENLGDVSGTGGTFDAGVMVRTGSFGLGAAAQNVGGRMRYGGASFAMPTSYGLGGSYEHRASGVRVALDLNFPTAYYSDVRTGIEWRWKERVALRTGYRRELGADSDDQLNGPAFGLGTGARGMWLDYGYLLGGNGEGQHRLGLTYRPGGMPMGGEPPATYGAGVRPAEPVGPPAPKPAARTTLKPVETAAPSRPPEPVTAPKSGIPAVKSAIAPEMAPAPQPQAVKPVTPEQSTAPAVATTPPPPAVPAPVAKLATPAPSTVPAQVTTPTASPTRRASNVTVQKGETLYQIARRWGTTVPAIMMENNMVSERVRAGQTLRLPQR